MLNSCLKSLVLLAAIVGGYYLLLRGRVTPPGDRWGAVALGFGMWIVAGLLWNTLNALSHRRKLKRARSSLGGFGDGERIAVAGTIRPLGEPLLAPFSRRPCVAYEYKMRPMNTMHRGQAPPQASGEALCPCVIEGPSGTARLLAWPFLESFAETQFDGGEHRANARRYVESTTFEQATLSSAFSKLKEILADDDGSIKVDMNNGGAIDAGSMYLSEKIVPAGANVCAIGRWSTLKGGIVPDPGSAQGVELIPGTLETVLSKLRKKALGYLAGALVMAAVINAIGFFVLLAFESDARPKRVADFHQLVAQDDAAAVDKALRTMKPLVDLPDSEHKTALLFARSAAVTRLLLDAGARVDAQDTQGRTALHNATIRGDVESMKLLLDRGANVDIQDYEGASPLMYAARHESPEPLRFLIVRGANLELRDLGGRSALDQAADYPGARQILLDAGAVDETLDTSTAPPLPEGCGDPGRVASAMLSAVASGDAAAANEARSSRIRIRETRASLEEMRPYRPTEWRCVRGWASATLATLEMEGRSDSQDFGGIVLLRLEPGGWKIKEERWSWSDRQ